MTAQKSISNSSKVHTKYICLDQKGVKINGYGIKSRCSLDKRTWTGLKAVLQVKSCHMYLFNRQITQNIAGQIRIKFLKCNVLPKTLILIGF